MLLRWYGAADGEDGGGEESGEVARMESRYLAALFKESACSERLNWTDPRFPLPCKMYLKHSMHSSNTLPLEHAI